MRQLLRDLLLDSPVCALVPQAVHGDVAALLETGPTIPMLTRLAVSVKGLLPMMKVPAW